MTILQTTIRASAADEEVLDFIDESVRALQEEGQEPRYLVLGVDAYAALRRAIAARFGRSEGTFESYQWLSIVLDPYRTGEICVLPGPAALADGVRAEQR